MKFIVLDSGKGGLNFVELLKNDKRLIDITFNDLSKGNSSIGNTKKSIIKDIMLNILKKYRNLNIVIACHSASSSIFNLINNLEYNYNLNIYEPIYPTCKYISNNYYQNVLILCTKLTFYTKYHKRILSKCDVKYIIFPYLAYNIETDNKFGIDKSLLRLNKKQQFLKNCCCVVLGCTHYNLIEEKIQKILNEKYNFKGEVINSNKILLDYIKSS